MRERRRWRKGWGGEGEEEKGGGVVNKKNFLKRVRNKNQINEETLR